MYNQEATMQNKCMINNNKNQEARVQPARLQTDAAAADHLYQNRAVHYQHRADARERSRKNRHCSITEQNPGSFGLFIYAKYFL